MNVRRLVLFALSGAVLGLLASPLHAQRPQIKLPGIKAVDPFCWELPDFNWKPRPGYKTKPPPVVTYEYVVTELNPFTGGATQVRRFKDGAASHAFYDRVQKVHWVKYRYLGINEPLRTQRFVSAAAAQRFIDTDGPAQKGAIPGVAFFTNETRIVPAIVRYERQEIRATR